MESGLCWPAIPESLPYTLCDMSSVTPLEKSGFCFKQVTRTDSWLVKLSVGREISRMCLGPGMGEDPRGHMVATLAETPSSGA